MFGIGFTEIIFVIVLSIVVLGPERLTEVGHFLGKAFRRYNMYKNSLSLKMIDMSGFDPINTFKKTNFRANNQQINIETNTSKLNNEEKNVADSGETTL